MQQGVSLPSLDFPPTLERDLNEEVGGLEKHCALKAKSTRNQDLPMSYLQFERLTAI